MLTAIEPRGSSSTNAVATISPAAILIDRRSDAPSCRRGRSQCLRSLNQPS
jgi:hypothetical protein